MTGDCSNFLSMKGTHLNPLVDKSFYGKHRELDISWKPCLLSHDSRWDTLGTPTENAVKKSRSKSGKCRFGTGVILIGKESSKFYPSITEMATALKLSPRRFQEALKENRSFGGYNFRYATKEENELEMFIA